MSRTADLGQLLSLRNLRQERAQIAVTVASDRLQAAIRGLSDADAAIEAHDLETSERERRFFETMQIRPVSQGELGRTQDRLHLSDHRRNALFEERDSAAERVADCERQLARLQEEWRNRLAARDKLAEAHRRLRMAALVRADAMAEQDADEAGADRARLAC